jgi:hypothetical protein
VILYTGTHETSWLPRVDVPLFVSCRRLRRSCPRRAAAGRWAMDSGGFTELRQYGEWRVTPEQYASEVAYWSSRLGAPDWVAPQDWMVEPDCLRRTGLTIADHQSRTVRSFLTLRDLGVPVIPVLQGWSFDDYRRCADLYVNAGVVLSDHVVGVGTLCRRGASDEVVSIVSGLRADLPRLHGFGVKGPALYRVGVLLDSADSLAWSYDGRRQPTQGHRSCANHLHAALEWRARTLAGLRPATVPML